MLWFVCCWRTKDVGAFFFLLRYFRFVVYACELELVAKLWFVALSFVTFFYEKVSPFLLLDSMRLICWGAIAYSSRCAHSWSLSGGGISGLGGVLSYSVGDPWRLIGTLD